MEPLSLKPASTDLDKERIRNFLTRFSMEDGLFYPVSYDSDTNECLVNTTEPVHPSSVTCNSLGSTWGPDLVSTRRWGLTRISWAFQLRLQFETEVSLEAFELQLAALSFFPGTRIPGLNRRHAKLLLTEVRENHPPTQGSGRGTKATFDFDIQTASY